MAGDIFGRRSRLEVEERKAGWGADEGGRLVRGAALTWALGERGDAGACAGRAGWAAARSWRVSGSAGRTGPSGALAGQVCAGGSGPKRDWCGLGQRLGLGSGKREGGSDGPDWVGFWFRVGLGFGFGSGLGFLFFSFYFFSFLNLNQTKFEFKY